MASNYNDPQYASLPRGIRNNNPGNIKYDGTSWQGMVGNDGTFVIFADMGWGVRALAKSLTTIINGGNNTITGIISQWAPASDGNDDAAYINSVSVDTGLDPNAVLSPDATTLSLLVRAIANHENGDSISQQYLSDADIADGLSKAGSPILAAAQAALVYAQIDPVTAITIISIVGVGLYYLTVGFKKKKT